MKCRKCCYVSFTVLYNVSCCVFFPAASELLHFHFGCSTSCTGTNVDNFRIQWAADKSYNQHTFHKYICHSRLFTFRARIRMIGWLSFFSVCSCTTTKKAVYNGNFTEKYGGSRANNEEKHSLFWNRICWYVHHCWVRVTNKEKHAKQTHTHRRTMSHTHNSKESNASVWCRLFERNDFRSVTSLIGFIKQIELSHSLADIFFVLVMYK